MGGNLFYTIDKESIPFISNLDELQKINGSFATNPTKLNFNGNYNEITLLSGDILPNGIS
eukprot:jgi/Orpsp1_1/1186768/evm.model.d7180000053179.1